MPLTDHQIQEFQKKIVDLTDTPSENMSPADLKAYFDSSPEELRLAVNSLIDDLTSSTAGNSGAKQIGVETISGLTGNDVQTLLQALKTVTDNKTDKTGDHAGTWQGKSYSFVNDRLNNIEQGATTDTEIIDARRKEDGTTFPTLPERLKDLDAQLAETFQQLVPKKYAFGGQLERMKQALSNPLEQFVSIVFIGDSITWGMVATGNPTDHDTGRDGTLSDIRDNFDSLSFVNNFKRYIGSKYAFNTTPALSNWSASPSGESIVEYKKEQTLFPYGGDFALSTTGIMYTAPTSVSSPSSLCDMQLQINVESNKDGVATVEFTFTGKEFTLSYDQVTNGMDYEVFVDGVSQGVFSTSGSPTYDVRRTHTFSYVKNKIIQIKTVKTAYVGVQTLKIGGLILNKTVKISNQGIIGATTRSYLANNLAGNTSGDGVAVNSEDGYVYMQLGTNDRIISSGVAKGINEYKKNLKTILNAIKTNRDVVLMCANPAGNENPSTYSFNMQEVRNVTYLTAKENAVDFIDNYSIFGDISTTEFTADSLHPNDYGHNVISRNIINCLEFN